MLVAVVLSVHCTTEGNWRSGGGTGESQRRRAFGSGVLLHFSDVHAIRAELDVMERLRLGGIRSAHQGFQMAAVDALSAQIEAHRLRLSGEVAGDNHRRLPWGAAQPGK